MERLARRLAMALAISNEKDLPVQAIVVVSDCYLEEFLGRRWLRRGSREGILAARNFRSGQFCTPKSIPVRQAMTASTMLAADAVGTTRVMRSPAFASNALYSSSVRSSPPATVSITMSRILPG